MKNHTFLMVAVLAIIMAGKAEAQVTEAPQKPAQHLITLVTDAATLVHSKGEAAFDNFRVPGSRWRQGETYIFVLDPEGNMIVHTDPGLEGKNQLDLKDVNGKPIIRGLLAAATTFKDKPEGWYHYQWAVPGGLLPRWKSSYVQLVQAPSGKKYVVGCGDYNDSMEREFVVDMVNNAVGQVEQNGRASFPLFYDLSGPFRAKDAYIFIIDPTGVELMNPGTPSIVGRNVMEYKDALGKYLIRDMLLLVQQEGSGWIDYLWPKAGESAPSLKSSYVRRAQLGDQWVLVGCGVYLPDAPKGIPKVEKMTAPELMTLVREAAVIFEKRGEKAFPEFRKEGTKWFHDDTYFFVWTMDGTRYFHAANPEGEGENMAESKDVLGRPLGKMFMETGASAAGEGWVHYMYPEPGDIFPAWKSSFVKRVKFPSGKQYIVGCGIYNMQMDKAFIEDVVNRAAGLVAAQGEAAFGQLRDKTGPFVFMDTYIFLDNLQGVELVNAAQPSLEGKNLIDERDAKGKYLMREYLDAAVKNGSAWVDYYWYRPGSNEIAQKHAFVKAVKHGGTTYVLGAGLYEPEGQGPGTVPLKQIKPVPTAQYEYPETRELVQLVGDAADLLRAKGEAAFDDFSVKGSHWQEGEDYIFVLDPEGNMLVHPDPGLKGKNQLELKDVNGKPIIRGLLATATTFEDKPEGWYHYQWPAPGGLFPRWKSSYVKSVQAPSGKQYIVGSGVYNDRMERAFVADLVLNAVREIEQRGKSAFPLFHDPAGPYIAKDAYIFVFDMNALEFVNPAFPNMEGTILMDEKDTNGKFFVREMIQIAQTQGAGWVEYTFPKPGESVPTQKSAYVHAARLGNQDVVVGCGVYLADAPKEPMPAAKMTASEMVSLVRDGAALLEEQGEKAYPELRQKGSRWLRDDTYFFVMDMNGLNVFHGANPAAERRDDRNLKDVYGRPLVEMMLDAGSTSFGEGWVHYMYPEPGKLFPAWKSSYMKRVTYPSGEQYIAGCGIYNMQMDKAFIEDLVNRAAALVSDQGKAAFDRLRDKKGPFVFMDTYVFVISPDGTELVNGGLPSLEGKNLIEMRDLRGRTVIRNEIEAAMSEGSAWQEFYWYLPGDNIPALKQTFVRKVEHNGEIFIVGSGLYEDSAAGMKKQEAWKTSWDSIEPEKMTDKLGRQTVFGQNSNLARVTAMAGAVAARHHHVSEEFFWVVSGSARMTFDDREELVKAGEMMVIPPNVPHSIVMLEETVFIDFFAPLREDWLRGEDQYLRK